MNALSPSSRRRQSEVEFLERRTLMSGWTDSDLVTGSLAQVTAMAADTAGNIYAVGSPGSGAIVREKLAGASSWVTIFSGLGRLNGVSDI